MVDWVGRNRVVVGVAASLALGLSVLLLYGFERWWPGCAGFNLELPTAMTVDRARGVLDACPEATADRMQEALVVDTVFPFLYATALTGLLLLLACWRRAIPWTRRWAARCASAVVVAAALDLTVENGSLALLTQDWPPGHDATSETLVMVAGLAYLTKGIVVLSSAVFLVLLLLFTAVHPHRDPITRTDY